MYWGVRARRSFVAISINGAWDAYSRERLSRYQSAAAEWCYAVGASRDYRDRLRCDQTLINTTNPAKTRERFFAKLGTIGPFAIGQSGVAPLLETDFSSG